VITRSVLGTPLARAPATRQHDHGRLPGAHGHVEAGATPAQLRSSRPATPRWSFDGQSNTDAAWYYPEPKDAAAEIRDHVAFWKGVEVTA
jgi:hypothetical protein